MRRPPSPRSTKGPVITKAEFDVAVQYTRLGEKAKRAAELRLVHGYTLAFIADALDMKSRQQVFIAADRVLKQHQQLRDGNVVSAP